MTGGVAVVTYSPTIHDSRVRRIVAALAESGRSVHLLSPDSDPRMAGLTRHSRIPPLSATRRDVLHSLVAGAAGSLAPPFAATFHLMLPSSRAAARILQAAAPAVIHANDWSTLPAAVIGAGRTGARVIYDSHENAVDEHAGLLWWRLAMRRSVSAIEHQLIRKADQVMTIGEGLAEALRARHGAAIGKLTVLRNIPAHTCVPLELRDEPVLRLVYAGLIAPERKIDTMIQALALLPACWRLDIIGFGPAGHGEDLRRLADKLHVSDRIAWQQPVPPERLVERLSFADVGLYLSAGDTGQQRVALPNKIFEYTAAGLAVATHGSAEASTLTARHGHGIPLAASDAVALANALRPLDRPAIESLRAQAGVARQELTWEREKLRLLAAYDALTPR